MAKKSLLKITVLVIGLISLAGSQMSLNNSAAAMAAADGNPADARRVKAQVIQAEQGAQMAKGFAR